MLVAVGVAAPAASAAPWPCDNAGYLTQFDAGNVPAGTTLNRADPQDNGTYLLNPLGSEAAEHINALGFRPQDGFMYGFNNTTQQVTRIQLDPLTGDPTFQDIGNPVGSGITLTVIGAILADGTYLVWQGGQPERGAIYDVSGPTAQLVTTVTLDPASPAGFRGDFATSPVDGQIYGVGPDNPNVPESESTWGIYRYTLSGGVLTRGARVADGSQAGGAAWFRPDGTFIMYANGTAGVPPEGNGSYGINLTTGQRTFLTSGPAFSNADGAACANGIALTKDATPRTVTAGQELTYTHTMTSRALQTASIEFADQLPAGMTYVPGGVTVSPPVAIPNNYGGTGTLTVSGTIDPQQTITITARVLVSPDHPCNVDVENQSQATLTVPGSSPVVAESDDPTTTDRDDPTIVHVNCSADVKIDKTATTSPLVPGEEATFTLVATNNGPSTARNVRVSDPLPDKFSFRSASPGCAEAGGTLTCTVGSLAPGASQTYTVTGLVASDLTRCLENTGTAISDTPDPVAANNTSTVCTPIRGESDLGITKEASRSLVTGGNGQVQFTLVVTNNGPSDDPNAEVNDPLVPGLTLVAADPSKGTCTTTNNVLDCDLGNLKVGGSAQVLVTAQMASTTCVTNTARVRGAHVDPNPDNNQASVQVCPGPGPEPRFDLEPVKSVNDTTPVVGQRLTYRIVVTNKGPDAAPAAKFTDTLTHPVRVVSVRTTAGTCGNSIPLSCELGTIAAGESVTITVVVRHRQAGCRQTNAASATGAGTDTNPANNLDTVSVCVKKVSLKVTKQASRDSVRAGDRFSYTIRVRNTGKGQARNVKTCDRLPSGLVYVSSSPRAKLSRGQHCWTAKLVKAGQTKVYKVTVRAVRGTSGRKTNTVTATSPDARTARAKETVRVIGGAVRGGGVTG